jgi:hypothetical protein|tara:strand:+ start:472 stop:765 length:294 start_codon:yes stop_codon:yes gene_type:complete
MYEEIPMKESRIKNMSIFDLYDWIEYNTDQNYHTENIVIIAMRFGDDEDIENAKYVMKRHEEETCMTEDLRKFRDYIFEKVMSKLDYTARDYIKKRL